MSRQTEQGGALGPHGTVDARIERNLGELRTVPGWRLRNLLQHRRRSFGAAAVSMLGLTRGLLTVQPELRALQFRPDHGRLGLDAPGLARVTELLRASAPVPLAFRAECRRIQPATVVGSSFQEFVRRAWQQQRLREIAQVVPRAEQWLRMRLELLDGADVSALSKAFGGLITDYGVLSTRLVTNNGAGFIVDAFQNLVELETMKFHGIGTTNTAEAAGDSALAAELSTVYNPDNTRATGTTTEQSAQVYETVGTNTVDGSAAVVEHGIFSQAATGGGTLLDRSVFSTINLASADSLQTTYRLTVNSGN